MLGGPGTLAGELRWMDLIAIGAGFFYACQNVAARAATGIPVSVKVARRLRRLRRRRPGIAAHRGHEFPPIDTTLALQLGAFTVFWLLAAMWTQVYGVSHLEAGRAAVLVVFELVAAVVSAMIIAGERLDTLGWIGAALITGAALVEARANPSTTKEQSP